MIQASKDRYYIRAWVGVLLGEDGSEEDTQCLFAHTMSAHDCSFSHKTPDEQKATSRTSNAFRSATPPALVSALTDLENSSLVCSSICSRSASVSSSSMRRRDARSGFRRKNSLQKPSDSLSCSASSSSFESQPVEFAGDRGVSSNLSSNGSKRQFDIAQQKGFRIQGSSRAAHKP